jgi:hypothetical protein
MLWYRVFGANDAPVDPAALLDHLHGLDYEVTGHFRGDEQGWFKADLVYPDADARLPLERFLATEEGIRAELNTWAAWLESTGDGHEPARLMQHVIGTKQLFTLHCPDEDADAKLVDELCVALCRYLATETAGVYQIDGRGFFVASGKLLIAET